MISFDRSRDEKILFASFIDNAVVKTPPENRVLSFYLATIPAQYLYRSQTVLFWWHQFMQPDISVLRSGNAISYNTAAAINYFKKYYYKVPFTVSATTDTNGRMECVTFKESVGFANQQETYKFRYSILK